MHDPSSLSCWESLDDNASNSQNNHSNYAKAGNLEYYSVAAARRRYQMACQRCFGKKTKCEFDGSSAACIQCIRRNVPCIFDANKSKGSLKRKQYIRSLEDRVEKAESLLKAAGVFDENAVDHESLAQEVPVSERLGKDSNTLPNTVHKSTGQGRRGYKPQSRTSVSNSPPISSDTPNSHRSGRTETTGSNLMHVPIFRADSREESRYFGRISTLSILSKDGLEWIKNKTGGVGSLDVLFSGSFRDSPWDYWRPDVFHDIFASHVYKPLPPRAEVFFLLRAYFRTVNLLFPLYHEASFMRLVEWQYTQQTCDDAARWASINVILALAYEYRFSNSQKPERDREKAWLYFKNAMSVFTELTFRRTDLLSVQALLGMATFLRGNSGTQAALPIITAALRSCQRMGLHRTIPRPDLSPSEQEQRRKVFWVAYVLDQSACIRVGNAPLQHVDDFDVPLPQERVDEDEEDDDDGNGKILSGFFRELCRITVIKARIYSELYSTSSLARLSVEICDIVHELDAELEEWKNTCTFWDQHELNLGAPDYLIGFASIGLRLVYYNCLIMIHRMPPLISINLAHHAKLRSKDYFEPAALSSQSSSSRSVCLQAAQDSLRLLDNIPWGDVAWLWSLLYYVLLAVITVFVNILRNSNPSNAREDLRSLNMAATFFAMLTPTDGPYRYATFMTKLTASFERLARVVVERNEKENRSAKGSNSNANASSNSTESSAKCPRKASSPLRSQSAHRQRPNPHSPPADFGIPNVSPTTNPTYLASNNQPHISDDPLHPNSGFPTTRDTPVTATADISMPQQRPDANFDDDNNMFLFSNTNSYPTTAFTSVPEYWQIPLTADWELAFGNQLWGISAPTPYLHRHDHYHHPTPTPQPQPPLSTTPLATGPSPSTHSVQSFPFYGSNNNNNSNSNSNSGVVPVPMAAVPMRDPLSGGTLFWMDGFLDSY